jgi:hypothetical protein
VRLFSGQNDAVLAWLGKRTDFTLSPHTQLLWATSDIDGTLLGAMGFGGRMGRAWGSVSIAIIQRRCIVPLIRAACELYFGQQQALAAYVTISSKRKRWIEQLVQVIGFAEVDRVPRGISDREDLVILKLTPESCRPWQRELRKLTQLKEAC